ncbi:MAG TPA: PQQ-binding-like beta-propeller repeat protein [Candidatus Anammoximicrobium sp.]|nr:PQQ-binding-like beta-propeller repeat protein [Candidatus Anammoximicrobium sp.]
MLPKLSLSLVTLLAVLSLAAGVQAADAQVRTWTDSTGQYRVRAAFLELKDGRVWLKKMDGSTVGVPLDRLSAADQGWVARQTEAPAQGTTAVSGEWLTFRGPNRDGKSPDQGLLKEWPEGGPKRLWKVSDIGKGWSGVAVAGGTVYVTGDVDDQLMLFAFDLDGQLKWKVDNGDKCDHGGYSGARATPTIDGSNLYLLSGNGRLGCFDARSGAARWSKDAREFGGSCGGWGYAESVLISGDWAMFKPGGERCIVALDKQTGEPAWTSRDFSAGPEYSSCLAVTHGGIPQIITGTNQGLVSVRAGSGEVLWKNGFAAGNTANCPTPVYSDGYVFWANGYGKGGICMKLDDNGGASEAYTTRDMDCHHGGYIIDNGHIYGNDGGAWKCLDLKTGDKKWAERAVGKGSVCWADGMLYLFSEENGEAALASCSPAGLEIKGKLKVDGEGPSWAHPVVIGSRLYLRYDKNLYCFDVKAR